jgi:hypothetical protein
LSLKPIIATSASSHRNSPLAATSQDLPDNETKKPYRVIEIVNNSEVLTNYGISGKISDIGIGFGTGRHTSARKNSAHSSSRSVTPQKA